jgi:para-nitrobenzyl esterase
MFKKLFLVLLILVAGGAGYRSVTAPQPSELALRQLDSGGVVGFDTGRGSLAWLGVPFARPPLEELRWRPPQPVQSWTGVREALEHPPFCTQVLPFAWLPSAVTFGEEDCLYLNVWTPVMDPARASRERLPVMVWIHGGANTLGGSAAADPYRFAEEEGVVVVSLQYRLGLLGWFSHPALRQVAEKPLDRSSNFALLDMIAALEWVQANIGAFGGDADNVTIFGQSAGAFDVLALLASPPAQGLFHKAIAQSGTVNSVPRSQAENYIDDPVPGLPESNREFINNLFIADGKAADRAAARVLQDDMGADELLEYLRGKSAKSLFAGVARRGSLGYFTPTNIRDGIVLPEGSMLDVFADPAAYNAVPVILGNNRDEYRMWLSGMDDFVQRRFGLWKTILDPDEYRRISAYFSDQWQAVGVSEPARALLSGQVGPVFTYRLDWSGQPTRWGVDESLLYGASHGIEVVLLFGREPVSSLPDFARTEDPASWDALSDVMRRYWANFARNGQPGGGGDSGLPRWEPWTEEEPRKMLLDSPRGGGVRMSGENVFSEDLKQRLRADPAIGSDRERCQLYAQLFRYALSSDFWDDDEYATLGCTEYPPEEFDGLI